MNITVAVDCMGGDHGPHVTVPAVADYLHRNPATEIILVGLPVAIESEVRAARLASDPRVRIHAASEVVGNVVGSVVGVIGSVVGAVVAGIVVAG